MSGAVIIQQTNGEQIDLSAMIQSAVTSAITDVEQQKKVQSKHGRSDKGSGSEYLGHALRMGRLDLGYSQSELARLSGVHPTTINKIEDGERGMSIQTLARLASHISEMAVRDILHYYAEEANAKGSATGSANPRGEAGGPEPEHSVSEQRSSATSATGGDGTYNGVGDEGSP